MRLRVEKANSVRSYPLSMKIFAAICHERKIPRSQGIRSPNSQRSELGNLARRGGAKKRVNQQACSRNGEGPCHPEVQSLSP